MCDNKNQWGWGKKAEKKAETPYELAQKRVKAIKTFYESLFSYLLVCTVLITVNLATGGFPWVLFVIAFWGLDVFSKWGEAYDPNGFLSKTWEEQKIQEFMAEEEGYQKPKRKPKEDYFETDYR